MVLTADTEESPALRRGLLPTWERRGRMLKNKYSVYYTGESILEKEVPRRKALKKEGFFF